MGVYSKMKNRINDSYGSLAAYELNQGSMDQMQSSENQAALSQMRNMLKDSLNTQAATAAVTGASPAEQAIAKQQATQALAQATQGIAANATSAKNNAMQAYYQANIAKNNAMNEIDKQKMSFIGGLANSAIAAGAKIGSAALMPGS